MKFSSSLPLLLGASLITTTLQAQSAAPVEVNGIAAKVNGRVITKNEVSFMLAPIYAQLNAQYPRRGNEFRSRLKQAQDKILQELIDRQIILDEFNQLGSSIPPNVIDNEIKRQINTLYNGNKLKFNEELRRNRMTMDTYREMQREKMIVQAMRSMQFSDAPPPLPNEIREEYNSVKNDMRDVSKDVITFRKIFLPAPQQGEERETQLALAEQLVKDLKAGKDFAELAKIHSKGAFADQGGLQENVSRMDLSGEFSAIIFGAKEGSIVGPTSDPEGFTIAMPLKISFGPNPSLSEVRDTIEERVRKKKTSAQYESWIKKRRNRAMIDIKIK